MHNDEHGNFSSRYYAELLMQRSGADFSLNLKKVIAETDRVNNAFKA